MKLVHQRQPSAKSCGPTSAAMLAGVSVDAMLQRLPDVRLTARRQKLRQHYTNIGEMQRLLAPYGMTFQKRERGVIPKALTLLRVDHVVGRGWHFAVSNGRRVFDPAFKAPVRAVDYRSRFAERLSWYRVQRAA